tara:strand:- start:12885 stop:13190 length:306 start_codon:yes stop_codon:yes gene_type:complete
MESFRVVCVDDSDRPDGIPLSKWVKKGDWYTVIHVAKLLIQGGKLGFKLAELNIDSCFPYQFFAANRFGIPHESDQFWAQNELERLLEEAKEESKKIIDIN